MSNDNLHHDHAGSVLFCQAELTELNARVGEVLGERAALCKVTDHSVDVDVPIPLIFDVDMYTRAKLPEGVIFINLRGEAYDRRYRLDVGVSSQGARAVMVDCPGLEGEAARAAWVEAWEAAERAGLSIADDSTRVALLKALTPAALVDEVEWRAKRACGLA